MENEIEVKEKGGDFHVLPMGNHQAVTFDIWDIGYQKGEYKGVPTASHKIIIGFEVNERIESKDEFNGQRFRIYKFYTLSLDVKANLRADLTSWRGKEFTEEELKGFKLSTILKANCFLNIIHDKKGKAKISAVTSLPKGIPPITPENKEGIPEWVAKFQAKAITKDEAEAIWEEAERMKKENEESSDIPF